MDDYYYSPLLSRADAIRNLRILPAVSFDHPIICEMHHVNLDEKPEYVALSYTWGGPVFDPSRVCDGRHLAIIANLDLALPMADDLGGYNLHQPG